MTPLRTQRCGNCTHATTTDRPTRMHCHHEPVPILLANGVWPSVFYDDGCGYWTKPEEPAR